TDSSGTQAYNMKLSRERAQSVANILRNSGVAGNRIATQGYGPQSPVASNATAAGRAQNRRVEILINPKPQ
ncbi:OmpA family protein, partial [Craterilacuibacter sp.]|uniref:OmpA family protein n=1 Tax=Craterilacuibacter sp. TaxID=2870909 RepID=UPI003F31DF92